jgi:hypothetical protein
MCAAHSDRPIFRPPRAHARPRAGPITFLTYPSRPPYPTKVLIHRVGVFRGSLLLAGYNCHDGRPLRCWYRTRATLPAGSIRRLSEGDRAAVLRFYPAPVTGHPGYVLFTEAGRWNVAVSKGTTVVGNVVINVRTRRG